MRSADATLFGQLKNLFIFVKLHNMAVNLLLIASQMRAFFAGFPPRNDVAGASAPASKLWTIPH